MEIVKIAIAVEGHLNRQYEADYGMRQWEDGKGRSRQSRREDPYIAHVAAGPNPADREPVNRPP